LAFSPIPDVSVEKEVLKAAAISLAFFFILSTCLSRLLNALLRLSPFIASKLYPNL
jgi:hypothetical protein